MNRCLIMRLTICSDGDFGIYDPKDRLKIFYPYKDDRSISESILVFHHDDRENAISHGKDMFCMAEVYLEVLLTSIHVSFTHYYILPHIYNFLNTQINNMDGHSKDNQQYISRLSGNYEGTEVAWVVGDPDDIIPNMKSVVHDLEFYPDYRIEDAVHHFYDINEIYP